MHGGMNWPRGSSDDRNDDVIPLTSTMWIVSLTLVCTSREDVEELEVIAIVDGSNEL
jgi:hypothetical protein